MVAYNVFCAFAVKQVLPEKWVGAAGVVMGQITDVTQHVRIAKSATI